MPAKTTADNVLDRFYAKTRRDEFRGCLIWTGATSGEENGNYARVWVPNLGHGRGRTVNAHSWLWKRLVGPIPDGLLVRHKCDNTLCVEIEHMELGTKADNAHDRDVRGRNANGNKTHCPAGHEYSEENTHVSEKGHRHCRACWRQWYHDNKGGA